MKKYYKSRNKNPNDNFVKLIQKAIIFSYASDIKGDLISEHKRIMTVSSRLNINHNKLDRVCILDKGIINPGQELYANDDENALGLFIY
ncbi:hypothetical protein [Kingella negevensis]|uniref:hypothetical protein n=1 Tax=Kingella negevensis TaxID=1522312 RepID=UPI00050A33E9|nr:hypothetical protein [Kingella negevensis]MDK4687826.1 hypothetical protein [Kingella negevensis]WII91179.1 hypothetical protein QEO93_00865 [Kingella negevensis]